MSRRRQKQAGVNHDRWLVSYADFITLLFAFFVVLYATSQMDNKKVVQVSAAIHGAFQELGVFSGSAQGSPLRVEAAPPGAVQPVRDPNQLAGVQGETGTGHGGAGVDVDRLKRELEEALGDEINRHEIEMRVTPEGLVVSLHELGFFNSGSAELLQEGQAPLGRIAHILNVSDFRFEWKVIPITCPYILLNSNRTGSCPPLAPPKWSLYSRNVTDSIRSKYRSRDIPSIVRGQQRN